jgi:hypothetical protein
MTSFLYERQIRIFDYPKFAEPYRNRIRENAEKVAEEAGVGIEFIRKRNFRKEDRVKELVDKRGEHTGLICVFSAMEPCPTYKPWHNKQTGKTYLVPDDGKCLHYYFYFMDEELGLCHARVPTWLPCRLQIYFNGHNWLAGPVAPVRSGLSHGRQCLHAHRRLATCAAHFQRLGSQTHPRATERTGPDVLPDLV